MPSAAARARVQQQQYVSQGRAIQRAARSQRVLGVGHRGISRPQAVRIRQRQQTQRAAAQQRYYVSQARAQRHAAAQQRQQARVRQARAVAHQYQVEHDRYRSQAREARRAATVSGPPTPSLAVRRRNLETEYRRKTSASGDLKGTSTATIEKSLRELAKGGGPRIKFGQNRHQEQVGAAALKVFDVVARPAYASAGASQALIRGKSVPKAIGRSLTGKQKTLYSDVLRDLGVKNKVVRGVAGFAGDVLLDPTTYVTFGASSVAKEAAVTAGRHAAQDAARRSLKELAPKVAKGDLSAGEAKRISHQRGLARGRKEATRHLAAAAEKDKRTGLTIRGPGTRTARRAARAVGRDRPISPVVRSTGAIGAGARAAARPVTRRAAVVKARRQVRDLGAEVNANLRPAGVSRGEQTRLKTLQRESRATRERGQRQATVLANKVHKRLKRPADRRIVQDALEANRLSKIEDEKLRRVAREIRDEFRHEERVGRRAGTLAGRVGERSRTQQEVERFGARTQARSTAPLRRELKTAEAEFARARVRLRAAKTDKARAGARQTLVRTSQRVTNLRGQIAGREAQAARYTEQTKGLRESRRERFSREARGYVPRALVEDVEPAKAKPLSELQHAVKTIEDKVRRRPGESVGVTRPQASAAKTRTYRASLKRIREADPERAAKFAEVSPAVIQRYGSGMRRAAAQANLNRGVFDEFGEDLKQLGGTQGITKSDLIQLEKGGTHAVYRLRRGNLEQLSPAEHAEVNLASRGRATKSAAQYKILRRDIAERAYDRAGAPSEFTALRLFDRAQNQWKRLALTTPGYLVRNFAGDMWNAYTDENAFRLAKNAVKGRAVLRELGRYERAGRKFGTELPESLREIKLTPEQIQSVAKELKTTPEALALKGGKANALQLAMLAERSGAIRQGRFLDLMEERGLSKVRGPKGGSRPFAEATKRVEDSVRIATFLGGLERGQTVRQAASRVAKIHFDYGDLTPFEKKALRRIMPFYTFTGRNIPFQARAIARAPGKYAHVQVAREEGRRQSDLPEGYEKGLNPFEQRQLGIPIKIGGKTATVSIGSPFVDLNDVANFARHPIGTPIEKLGETASPFKAAAELVFNYSLFYRDQIEKEGRARSLTPAPNWAIAIAKANPLFAKATHMERNYADPKTGKRIWAWPRKVDYASRQLPGAARVISTAPGIGVSTTNARGFGPLAGAIATLGPRITPYSAEQSAGNLLYAKSQKLDEQMALMRRTLDRKGDPINADNPTPAYNRLRAEKAKVERQLDQINRSTRAIYKGKRTGRKAGGLRAPSLGGGGGGGLRAPTL